MMEHKRNLDATAAEIAAMAAVLDGVDMATPVPSCPGWDLAELTRHTGRVHRWVRHIVATRATEFVRWKDVPMDMPNTDEHLAAWLAAGAGPLVSELSVDPATHVWSFTTQPTVGWWGRRQLHETLVHRADAELALGRDPVVDTEIAIDGIDELVSGLLPFTGAPAKLTELGRSGASVHFHTTDGPGEWTVVLTDGGFTVTPQHQKSTAAVRGSATDLLLLLWNRRTPSDGGRYECFGDTDFIEQWLAATVI
jgi:uncharacterized protein (TIGR03083 family)